jgi:hypothetical protein
MFKMGMCILFLVLVLNTPAIADDTPALQRLLANTPSGGEAFIGPGILSIQPQGKGPMLPITSNITVRCAAGTVLRVADHTLVGGLPGVVFGGYTADGKLMELSHVVIDNCTIDGNSQNNPNSPRRTSSPFTPPAIEFSQSSGITIQNVRFVDLTYGAIWLFNVQDSTIIDNDIYHSSQSGLPLGDAIQLNGVAQTVVANNHLTNVGEGIFVQHSTGFPQRPARNVSVVNNTIENLDANGICTLNAEPFLCCTGYRAGSGTGLCAAGISPGSSIGMLAQDTIVMGNMLRNAAEISVQSGRGFPTQRVAVTNNISTGSKQNCLFVSTLPDAVGNTGEALMSVRLMGNICQSFAGQGVQVLGNSKTKPIQDLEIDSNVFNDACDAQCSALVTLQDLGGQGIRNLSLTSNSFVGLAGVKPVVFFEGVRGGIVKGNTLTRSSSTSVAFHLPETSNLLWHLNWAMRRLDFRVLTGALIANGSLTYCFDCKQTNPCASGGTGALAKYLDGQWRCN